MSSIDFLVSQDNSKGCTSVLFDFSQEDVWDIAEKLQKADFVIKKIVEDDEVIDYDPEKFTELETWAFTNVILEYEYAGRRYTCEVDENRILIFPQFKQTDYLKRKLYESVINPSSVYLQTAIENIDSAELNLSMGSIRSASSDIYYAIHNLLKSIRYNYSRDERILTSDNHPPLFLAKIQLLDETLEQFESKMANSFKAEKGKIDNWVKGLAPSVDEFEEKIKSKNSADSIGNFIKRANDITDSVLAHCKNRIESEHPQYNIYNYLEEIRSRVVLLEEVSQLTKALVIPIIAAYEARVLGDYKFNFESIVSRKYISLLFWFADDIISLVKYQAQPRNKNTLNNRKVSKLPIVANKLEGNSVLGIVKVVDGHFDPVILKNILVEEWAGSVSLIGWEKDYPIKIQYLESGKSPVSVEIQEGNQIDVFLAKLSETSIGNDTLQLVERVIEDICGKVLGKWGNAHLKISPITLTYQQKLIRLNSDSRESEYEKNQNFERNIIGILSGLLNNVSEHDENLTFFTAEYFGVKFNFWPIKTNGTIRSYLNHVVGTCISRRVRYSCDFTIAFVNQSTFDGIHNMYKEVFDSVNIFLYCIPDDQWHELSHDLLDVAFVEEFGREFLGVVNDFSIVQAAVSQECSLE